MARAPAAAPMPADPMMGGAPPADDMGAAPMAPAEGEEQAQVLCTIVMNADGTLGLFEGDEPESMHGGEEMAEGEDMGAEAQTFDSVGPLLKAVLDVVQTAMDGGESGADQMRQGYAGDEAAAPAAPAM